MMKACDSRYSKCLYFVSSALSRKVEKMATESWKPAGLSPSHGYLLMIVIEEPGVHPGFLVEQLQLSPSTITRLIEKLEEKKLVVRTTEGKTTHVFPTTKGIEMLPVLKACVDDFHHRYSMALTEADTDQLVTAMLGVADKLWP